MALFRYTGFSATGQTVNGTIDADSERLAFEQLAGGGITPIELVERAPSGGVQKTLTVEEIFQRWRGEHVPSARRAQFVNELATLIKADVPLLESIRVLGREEPHEALKRILADLESRVQRGESFSHALAAHPRAFPILLVTMVRVGETGGHLGDVLAKMADWMEHEEDVRGEVRGAMVYPSIIILLAIVSVGVLTTFVLPKFKAIFAGMGGRLPLPTRILMGVSDWVTIYGWTIPILLVVGIVVVVKGLKTPFGRQLWDKIVLRLPIVGPLVLQSQLARFSAACESLLAAGVPLLEVLKVVRGLVSNTQMVALVEGVTEKVTKGQPLAKSLGESVWFPPAVTHLLGVGERTGRLSEMFGHVARRFEKQTRARVRILVNLLSPLMIVALAIGIGIIAASILLPIYQMNEMMR